MMPQKVKSINNNNMEDGHKIENAIIIGGKVYELVDDSEDDECLRCALKEECSNISGHICVMLFDDVIGKRFKER